MENYWQFTIFDENVVVDKKYDVDGNKSKDKRLSHGCNNISRCVHCVKVPHHPLQSTTPPSSKYHITLFKVPTIYHVVPTVLTVDAVSLCAH